MRSNTQFNPPVREQGEGIIAYTARLKKAQEQFEDDYRRVYGCTRDEHLKKLIPIFDE
jgi:hypothetical protein